MCRTVAPSRPRRWCRPLRVENDENLRFITSRSKFVYDTVGQLRRVDLPDKRIDYVIDPAGRRAAKKVNGKRVRGYLYDAMGRVVVELDGQNEVISRFIYGSRGHVPDLMLRDYSTYRLVTDYLGSVRLVVDVSTSEVVQRIDYDAWGKVLSDTNPGFQPFGFAGGLYDADTGLVRFGARDYDARAGRWTAKDPILLAGGDTNLYGYVVEDPVNLVDPIGTLVIYGGIGATAGIGYKSESPNLVSVGGGAFFGSPSLSGGPVSGNYGTASYGTIVGATLGWGFIAGINFGNVNDLGGTSLSTGINFFGLSIGVSTAQLNDSIRLSDCVFR
jgi:RHS repeat-associated protein